MEPDVIDHTAPSSEVPETSVEVTEELLVEEISIDGMCGVY
jgi:mycofactocin precursor